VRVRVRVRVCVRVRVRVRARVCTEVHACTPETRTPHSHV